MTKLTVVIIAMMFVGTIFTSLSFKKRSSLDTPLISNRSKAVIGLFLILIGIIFAVGAFLKGVFS